MARSLGDKSIEREADDIALSKQTATRYTEEHSDDVSQQLKDFVKACTFLSLALNNDNLSVFDERFSLESLHRTTIGLSMRDLGGSETLC